jgi:hypothetical protein
VSCYSGKYETGHLFYRETEHRRDDGTVGRYEATEPSTSRCSVSRKTDMSDKLFYTPSQIMCRVLVTIDWVWIGE